MRLLTMLRVLPLAKRADGLIIADGNVLTPFERPISGTLLALTLSMVAWAVVSAMRARWRRDEAFSRAVQPR